VPQYAHLPESTATLLVAVATAFACEARFGLLDPGEVVCTDTSGASSRNQRGGRVYQAKSSVKNAEDKAAPPLPAATRSRSTRVRAARHTRTPGR